MIRGLNVSNGSEPIGRGLLRELRSLNVGGIRVDCQHRGRSAATRIVQEIVDEGFPALAIVAGPSDLPDVESAHLEVGNEPDLQRETVPAYAARVMQVWRAASAYTPVWAGAVSNLNQRGLSYLRELVLFLPQDVGVTVHRYPHDTWYASGPTVPHAGFPSRESEVAQLRALLRGRPWGVSEFGYHTAARPRGWGPFRLPSRRWTDAEVRHHVAWEWAFWARQGATFAALYQINDGPSDTAEHRYGIRTAAGGTWKPVAGTFLLDV